MKKIFSILLTLLLFVSIQSNTFAAEEQPGIPYFGIGAVVEDLGDGIFRVKTEGSKKEEGFVYTPPEPFTKQQLLIEIMLKGEGTVLLKVSETNARGQFIKEDHISIELTEQWEKYEIPFTLESTSSQIDISVVTEGQEKIDFSYKELNVTEQ